MYYTNVVAVYNGKTGNSVKYSKFDCMLVNALTLFRFDILGISIGAVRSISDAFSVHSSVGLVMAALLFPFAVSLSLVIVVTTIVSDD